MFLQRNNSRFIETILFPYNEFCSSPGEIQAGLPDFSLPSFSINKTMGNDTVQLGFSDVLSELGASLGIPCNISVLHRSIYFPFMPQDWFLWLPYWSKSPLPKHSVSRSITLFISSISNIFFLQSDGQTIGRHARDDCIGNGQCDGLLLWIDAHHRLIWTQLRPVGERSKNTLRKCLRRY